MKKPSSSDFSLLLILVAAIFASTYFILQDSGRVPQFPMDQYFVDAVDLRIYLSKIGYWVFQYPPLQNAGGITSALIAGIYKLFVPTYPDNLNWHIRILAMVGYLISSFFLVRLLVKEKITAILSLLVIVTSGFQYIQPSSELFAGTLLNLFLISLLGSWPNWLIAFFLATFGLSKVEISLAAVVIAFFCSFGIPWRGKAAAKSILPYTLGWMLLLLAPGFLVQSGSALEGNRSYLAFIATYVELFQNHQFYDVKSLPSGEAFELVQKNILGESTSVFSIAMKHPMIYADFLALQTIRSLIGTFKGIKFMIIPFIAVGGRFKNLGKDRFIFVVLLLACALTLLPPWLLAYVRLRYWVKLFPAFIAIVACCSLSLDIQQKGYKWLFIACSALTIIFQIYYLPGLYSASQFQ